MARVRGERGVAHSRLTLLLRAASAKSVTFLRRQTHGATSTVCKGRIFVHKLVRFAGCYGGSYVCYNVQGDGHGTRHCHLARRRVLSYYTGKCRLKFQAFILRKKRSPCFASSGVYTLVQRVGTRCPSYTIALSVKRGRRSDCRTFFSTNTSQCLLHRRATSRTRCKGLRPTRVF